MMFDTNQVEENTYLIWNVTWRKKSLEIDEKNMASNNNLMIDYTANVFAVKVTGFPCVTLEPCKVHITVTGK